MEEVYERDRMMRLEQQVEVLTLRMGIRWGLFYLPHPRPQNHPHPHPHPRINRSGVRTGIPRRRGFPHTRLIPRLL